MTTKKTAVKKAAPKKKVEEPKLEKRHEDYFKKEMNLNQKRIDWMVKTFGAKTLLETFTEEVDGWTGEKVFISSLNNAEYGYRDNFYASGSSMPYNCGVFIGEAKELHDNKDVMNLLLSVAKNGYRHCIVTTNHTQKDKFEVLKSCGFEVVKEYMGNPNHSNKTQIAVLICTIP